MRGEAGSTERPLTEDEILADMAGNVCSGLMRWKSEIGGKPRLQRAKIENVAEEWHDIAPCGEPNPQDIQNKEAMYAIILIHGSAQ